MHAHSAPQNRRGIMGSTPLQHSGGNSAECTPAPLATGLQTPLPVAGAEGSSQPRVESPQTSNGSQSRAKDFNETDNRWSYRLCRAASGSFWSCPVFRVLEFSPSRGVSGLSIVSGEDQACRGRHCPPVSSEGTEWPAFKPNGFGIY